MIKTKQELLNHFSDINAMYNNPFMYQTLSNMIDELLDQQPCEDVISRQALIEKATSWDKHFGDSERCVSLTDIQNAPSVTPQPKTDEIIKRIEEARDKDQIAEYPYNRCIKIIREVLGDD